MYTYFSNNASILSVEAVQGAPGSCLSLRSVLPFFFFLFADQPVHLFQCHAVVYIQITQFFGLFFETLPSLAHALM